MGHAEFNICVRHPRVKEAVGLGVRGKGEKSGLEVQVWEPSAFRWCLKQQDG